MFYLATYESRNFTFEGFGTDKGMALTALTGALRKHGEQIRRIPGASAFPPPGWADDIEWRELKLGHGYRDEHELLIPEAAPPDLPAGMTDKQVTTIKCAYADLAGVYQTLIRDGLGVHDGHDWKAHRVTIIEMEQAFSFIEPVKLGDEDEEADASDL